MKYKLGDFVRFIDERREGYITRIFDEQMVGVTDSDDFEIPVMVNNITHVHGHETYREAELPKIRELDAVFIEKGIFLAVLTDKGKPSVVHFHLVNETSFELLFSFNKQKNDVVNGIYADKISAKTTLKIHSESLPDLDLWPIFNFQLIYFLTEDHQNKKLIDFSIKFKSKDFSTAKTNIPMMKEHGWLFKIDEKELVIDAQKLKESFFKPAEEKKSVDAPAKEIDLHIEKLRDDYAFLSNSEILRTQLDFFRKSLDAAIVHKYREIVIIHGIGNGTLKNEIHKLAGKHPQIKTFKDAQKQKFGYGATEIILK